MSPVKTTKTVKNLLEPLTFNEKLQFNRKLKNYHDNFKDMDIEYDQKRRKLAIKLRMREHFME